MNVSISNCKWPIENNGAVSVDDVTGPEYSTLQLLLDKTCPFDEFAM